NYFLIRCKLPTECVRKWLGETIYLSLLEWTGHRQIGDPLTLLLCAYISETTNKINWLGTARQFYCLTHQDFGCIHCIGCHKTNSQLSASRYRCLPIGQCPLHL